MNRIKILLGAYIDSVNAQDINCYNIGKYLDKSKFEVHAFTHGEAIDLPDVKVHKISKNRLLKNIQKYITMNSLQADIYYLPRVEKVDILFSRTHRKARIVSSVEIQTVYNNETYKKFFNTYCSGYFCISNFLNELNKKYWGNEVPVIYLGVDKLDKTKKTNSGLKTIIWVGSVVKRKRPALLLEVAKKLPETQFVMVGDGDLLPEIRNKIAKEKISNVQLTGKLENRDVIAMFHSSDLLLMTSEMEGLPKVILEAASCGVPSIYLNENYSVDYIIDNINGFGVSNIDEMISKVESLINDRISYMKMSNEAAVAAEKYLWSNLIHDYEMFFQEHSKREG